MSLTFQTNQVYIEINDYLFAILHRLCDLYLHYLWLVNDACDKYNTPYTRRNKIMAFENFSQFRKTTLKLV